jgi:large subunit ribosomal protein L13
MRTAAMKSYLAKTGESGGAWHLVDAENKVLGRLAAELATILMGKHLPTYTPHVLSGDFVVLINAKKVKLTGRKMEQEFHDTYSYHPGGRKVVPIKTLMEKKPELVIHKAVRRMLPKNKLGDHMLKRLKVYPGAEHPHAVQNPQPLELLPESAK